MTDDKERVRKMLDAHIPWEEITYRAANKQKTLWLAYVSGEYVRRTLNRIFGWDGWNFAVTHHVFREQGVEIKGELSIGFGGFLYVNREALAFGTNANGLDFAAASGVTDALKRAAATLGSALGLQLYVQRSGPFKDAWAAIGEGQDVMDRVRGSEVLTTYEIDFLTHFHDWLQENN